MSIFAKKSEGEQGSRWDRSLLASKHAHPYGIAEAVQLLRSLPNDQNGDLIVRVVRSTLESLNVHLPDIIADATRKQELTQERLGSIHGQVADLEKQLEALRHEIAELEADLKETSDVKERLEMADKGGGGAQRAEHAHTLGYGQQLPPPLPGGAR
jgi:septal ring factor EnvC (AmiA/AmiB activator)